MTANSGKILLGVLSIPFLGLLTHFGYGLYEHLRVEHFGQHVPAMISEKLHSDGSYHLKLRLEDPDSEEVIVMVHHARWEGLLPGQMVDVMVHSKVPGVAVMQEGDVSARVNAFYTFLSLVAVSMLLRYAVKKTTHNNAMQPTQSTTV